MARRPQRTQFKFNGGKMGDIPQITSSNAFLAKTSGKEKGITVEDDLLLISNRKHNSRTKARNSASKKPDSHRPNPIKYSNLTNITAFKKHEVPNVDEDDYIMSDDDSDTSQNSQESRKWFKEFFEKLDSMNIQEIAETVWHCPACADGPGAGKWYRTIQDLITHAKKIVTKRLKLHHELAELLEGYLCSKRTSIPPSGEVACKVKGLKENAIDHQIIWPPMVVIMNTRTTIDEDGKFVGVGSQSLFEQFSSYPVLKVKHSYGPQGHRGLSVLIFESSAMGYLEADRLHKNFVDQGLDRFSWNSAPDDVVLSLPGEERQLYGFIAVKEDLDIFNKHHQDKSKIKYELKSYQEIVLNNIKQMSEDNQHLPWLKDTLVQERKHSKSLDELVHNLRRNLQQKITDIHIFVKRVQLLHEQNKEETDFQENFYQDQIKTLEAKVKELERLQESKTL